MAHFVDWANTKYALRWQKHMQIDLSSKYN